MHDDFPCVKSLSSRVGGALNHFRVAWLYHQAFQNLRSGGEIGVQLYPSQTKDVEGGTKDEILFFREALFKGSSPKSSTHSLTKRFAKKPDFIFCSSVGVRPHPSFASHKLLFIIPIV
jgi:hypothetical protein